MKNRYDALLLSSVLLLALVCRAASPGSIEILHPNRAYKRSTSCDIRRVDFRNFRYFTGEWMSGEITAVAEDPVIVTHGKYHFREDGGFEDVVVEAVQKLERKVAVVSLLHNYGGGSSNQELIVLVFQCVGGELRNTQLIHGDGHGKGAGVDFSEGGRRLIMNSVDDYTYGHCCPRFLESAEFRFNGQEYILGEVNRREIYKPADLH